MKNSLRFAAFALSTGAASSLAFGGCGGTVGEPSASPDAGRMDGAITPDLDGVAPIPDSAVAMPTPIKHVIIIVKENHTFDNYFGSFPGAEGTTQCLTSAGMIPCPHAPDRTPRDLCHAHDCAVTDWHKGAMDAWDSTAAPSRCSSSAP